MPLYYRLPEAIKEVDVIIAGGGTAACIVAARLSAASPSLSILLIELGKNNYNEESVIHPALFSENVDPSKKHAIFYQGKKSDALAGRAPIVPSGGILGGGSSINFMMYTRAQRCDFDSWETPGWSADELIPFLQKLETYHGPGLPETHGYSGPVQISSGTYRCVKSEDDLIAAAAQVGYPEIKDLQDLDSNNGVSRWLMNVSPDGRRQDTAHTYLHPLLRDEQHPNLHVLVESKVVRIIFDENQKACGIEYIPNADFQAGDISPRVVAARKLVVVSCGACGTPSVLERSGIGSPDVLKKAAVTLIADVPGVGHDYQDHNLIFYPYRTSLGPEETLDAFLSGRYARDVFISTAPPLLGWNSVDGAAKVRPTEEEVASLGPEFQAAWDRDFKHQSQKPLMCFAFISSGGSYVKDPSTPPGQYFTMGSYTSYPYSRGSIHINSPSVNDSAVFDTRFFSDAHDIDLKKQIWAYKKQREIMRRTNMYRGELEIGHPRFPLGSKAACANLSNHPRNLEDVKDLVYDQEDDRAIEQWLRENINTTWHSLGTAKMAPREDMGVVDSELNVYGVQGLKIVDLSIVPKNVCSNTCNTAMMIGEKGADIIMNELGLQDG